MEEEISARRNFDLNLKELWEYRELFYFFTWRDVKVKYKQTFLGIAWAVIQPLAIAFILTFSLGESIGSNYTLPIPYILFTYSGFMLWTVFSGGLTNSANSMVSNANIIKKIYFPRLIIPFSSILSSVFDFFFSLVIFVVLTFVYKCHLSLNAIWCIPLGLLLTVSAALGTGVLLSALSVKYRDFRYVVPFLVQGLLFLTPVIYPVTFSNNRLIHILLQCNPVAAGIEILRYSFSEYPLPSQNLLYSIVCNVALIFIGVLYFRKTESYFADLA